MKFNYEPDVEAFRKEVQDFIQAELPPEEERLQRGDEGGFKTYQEEYDYTMRLPEEAVPRRTGWRWPGRRSTAAAAPATCASSSTTKRWPTPARSGRQHGHRLGRPEPDALRHRRAEGSSSSRASRAPMTGGARSTPSRAPAPTSPRCRPAPSATATSTSSTARRSGPPAGTSPTGAGSPRAPTRTRRSTRASRCSWST